jgi:hypothetical protein
MICYLMELINNLNLIITFCRDEIEIKTKLCKSVLPPSNLKYKDELKRIWFKFELYTLWHLYIFKLERSFVTKKKRWKEYSGKKKKNRKEYSIFVVNIKKEIWIICGHFFSYSICFHFMCLFLSSYFSISLWSLFSFLIFHL